MDKRQLITEKIISLQKVLNEEMTKLKNENLTIVNILKTNDLLLKKFSDNTVSHSL